MKSPLPLSLALLVLLCPGAATAGEMTEALALSGSWGSETLGIARGLFPPMLLIALLVELLFRPPGLASVRAALKRGVLVFVLLVGLPLPSPGAGGAGVRSTTVYGWVCFGLAGLSDSVTASLAPKDVWQRFEAVNEQWQRQLLDAKDGLSTGDYLGAQLGGILYGALIALGLGIGQAAMWVMGELGRVLAILLYAVGPLALVFWLPVPSDSLGRWLRTFVSVLCWPVLSALILSIILSSGLAGLERASPAFASIATALLLSVCACAVPLLASSLVGGGIGAIGAGLSAVTLYGSAGTLAAGKGLELTSPAPSAPPQRPPHPPPAPSAAAPT